MVSLESFQELVTKVDRSFGNTNQEIAGLRTQLQNISDKRDQLNEGTKGEIRVELVQAKNTIDSIVQAADTQFKTQQDHIKQLADETVESVKQNLSQTQQISQTYDAAKQGYDVLTPKDPASI